MTTVLCGSISALPSPLGRAMHEAGYAALGLDFAYVPFQVADVPGALTGMRALGIRGFGVSMPFKLTVMPLLDRLDPLAERIGAVNTIVNDAGRLTGYNTDAAGARRAVEEVTALAGLRVALLGAGGAARAVAFALLEARATLSLVNRTRAHAEALAAHLTALTGRAVPVLDPAAPPPALDLVVNASSGGMRGVSDGNPLPQPFLDAAEVVMDIVYKPIETELVRAARDRGKRVIHGGRMLLHQAAAQFELYTGHPAPLDALDAALQRTLPRA